MKVFITGGTGSLGRALLDFLPKQTDVDEITVYSRDEVKQGETRRLYPDVNYMLGDVRDYDRLLLAMRGHDAVIHAGAYKQVPSAEANVDEAIYTNVFGSLNVARAALLCNVTYVIGVSTDKACMPVNAYGATKSLMEKLFQQFDGLANNQDTIFNVVRYGNVLGSRGSVVPLFRSQMAARHFTVTDPHMTRFWMTLQDAVNLVWATLSNEAVHDGAILVPECPASDMLTLLRAVVKEATGQEDDSYDIESIGTRPGEKTHEQLVHRNESIHTLRPTDDVPYFQILPATAEMETPQDGFEYLSAGARQLTVDELVDMIRESDQYA